MDSDVSDANSTNTLNVGLLSDLYLKRILDFCPIEHRVSRFRM